MQLDLGGQETLESPTSEDVRHYLRYMRSEAPFVILSDGTGFIQALSTGSEYRVEYRLKGGREQYYCLADYGTACDLFLDFLSEGTGYQTSVQWKRLRLETALRAVVVAALCILMGLAIVAVCFSNGCG